MTSHLEFNGKHIRLQVGLITEIDGVDGIVHYARPDLALGSGYGTAISTQGGPAVQQELKKLGSAKTTEVVVTGGGNLKARFILHAVGPRFQEEQIEEKLRQTMRHALQKAEELALPRVAFPAMGAGFYGVPLDVCARITLESARTFLSQATALSEVVFCLRDQRELKAFEAQLQRIT